MAASNINIVAITGNLTRDPELRSTPSGTSVCKLRVAVNSRRKDGRAATGSTSPTTSTSPSGARRARTAPTTSPRAGRWPSRDASTGANGRRRTAPSARRSRSSPTASSSWAPARTTRAGRWRQRLPAPVRRPGGHLGLRGRDGQLGRRLGRRHSLLATIRALRGATAATDPDRLAAAGAAVSPIAGGRVSTRGSTSTTSTTRTWACLRRFISDRGKTRSRRVTGLSRKHQQQLALAVKRARELALLPYVGER